MFGEPHRDEVDGHQNSLRREPEVGRMSVKKPGEEFQIGQAFVKSHRRNVQPAAAELSPHEPVDGFKVRNGAWNVRLAGDDPFAGTLIEDAFKLDGVAKTQILQFEPDQVGQRSGI